MRDWKSNAIFACVCIATTVGLGIALEHEANADKLTYQYIGNDMTSCACWDPRGWWDSTGCDGVKMVATSYLLVGALLHKVILFFLLAPAATYTTGPK